MNHLATRRTRLLVRPEHIENESLCGYVSRVSSRNASSQQFKPMLASLKATTDAIQEIAMLTGCNASLLSQHGSHTQVPNDRHSGVQFGNCILSPNQVWIQRRMICPKCLSKNGVSICCWMLRDYDVCHEHGCYMVGHCSGCDRLLSWASTSSETCLCGLRLTDIETGMAPMDRVLMCKLIADEMSAITAQPNQSRVSGSLTPLNLFFIVSNFVRSVLIPGFAQKHLGAKHSITKKTCEQLLLVILKDSEYYGHLRQVIFLHAVENPITIKHALGKGFSDKEMREYFLPCLRKVIPHSQLFKIAADAKKKKMNFQPAAKFIKWAQREAAGST